MQAKELTEKELASIWGGFRLSQAPRIVCICPPPTYPSWEVAQLPPPPPLQIKK